jgi:hypothetical protein
MYGTVVCILQKTLQQSDWLEYVTHNRACIASVVVLSFLVPRYGAAVDPIIVSNLYLYQV